MAVLILGGSGQLGSYLRHVFRDSLFTYNSTQAPGGIKLNLTEGIEVEDLVLKLRPSIVINAAAYTDVDACEKNREIAFKVNAKAVKHVVRACSVVKAYFVHVSTDYVFDGERGLYREEDLPNPVNYYGLTKLLGETYALSYDHSLVVRTSGVFSAYGHNFPSYALKALREGREVKAIESLYSPIHALALAKSIGELVSRRKTGIVNVAGDRVSRYELALRIADRLGVDRALVKSVRAEELRFEARRPKDSSLDVSMAKGLIDFDFHSTELNLSMMFEEADRELQ